MGTKYGIVAITDPERGELNFDAYLCCHCQQLCVLQPPAIGDSGTRGKVFLAPVMGRDLTRTEQQGFLSEPGYCSRCDAHHCGKPECNKDCIPVEAKLEFLEGTRSEWKQTEIRGW